MADATEAKWSFDNMPPTLVLICGLPGAGKTTLAKEIEHKLPALRLTPDDWMDALSINLWDEEKRAQIEALQWQTAQRALSLGANVVMDFGFWSRGEREHFRRGAASVGAGFELRFVDVPLEELWTRIQSRHAESPQIQRSDLERWWQAFEPPTPEELD